MSVEQSPLTARRRVRSGGHLKLRGEIWYYRRAVPKDVRKAFECSEVVHSLETTSLIEAERFEKAYDVEFQTRLHAARSATDPRTNPPSIGITAPVT